MPQICVGYYRSVFVLVPSDKLPEVLVRKGAMGYMLKQLKQSVSDNATTEKDKILAKLIISNLYLANNRISALETMFDCAYKWKDVAIWRDLIEGSKKDVGVDELIRAFRVFKFDQTRPMYVI